MKSQKSVDPAADEVSALRLRPEWASSPVVFAIGKRVARTASYLLLLVSLNAFAANGETFAILKVADHTYQNVRVTTKAKNFIIIQHSGGITSIKVSELSADALVKLGYAPPPPRKKPLKEAAMWASLAVPKTEAVLIKPIKAKFSQIWQRIALNSKLHLSKPTPRQVVVGATIMLMAYLFYSYCCLLICQKTGNKPGVWVWLPLVQAFPMLRAASMSPWWFAALFIPGLNLVAYVLWCLKIVEARHKTVPLTILLLLPITTWFAFICLAFSEDSSRNQKEHCVGLVTARPA